MRNRFFREIQAKDCQEIEELTRICCVEAYRARQARNDELSLRQEGNPTAVSQSINDSDSGITEQSEFFDASEFYDPETARSSAATHVPSQPSAIPSSRTMPHRDSGLPHDTQNGTGTTEHVFERPPAQERRTSPLFHCQNLASSSQELRPDTEGNTKRPEGEMRRESRNSSITVPLFQSGGALLNHTGGTYFLQCMVDYPSFPMSELNLAIVAQTYSRPDL